MMGRRGDISKFGMRLPALNQHGSGPAGRQEGEKDWVGIEGKEFLP
jgi:hypothetical protein